MASHASTPRSLSRSSTGSSGSSDTAMLDAPPHTPSRPVRLRHPSSSNPPSASQPAPIDPSFSLLLSLPRELRERIYNYALTTPLMFPCPQPLLAPFEEHKHDVGVNLLRANKQIYEESVSILYSGNKFIFYHPSDCNIFRVIASPASQYITSVYFRIREKDLRLWTSYMGSKSPERSLKADLPKLKHLGISMRFGRMNTGAAMLAHGMQANALAGLPPAIVIQVQAVQHALAQQIAALNHQEKKVSAHESNDDIITPLPPHQAIPFSQFQAGNLFPVPPPPPPVPAHHQNQHHNHQPTPVVYGHHNSNPNHFLRFERELGIESICLSLQETRRKDTDVKIVCTMRIPRREVERLLRVWPDELERCDRSGGMIDARTRFRKVGGVEVCLEVSGYPPPGFDRLGDGEGGQ